GTTITQAQIGRASCMVISDITANKLTFATAIDANGSPYASFTFQVQDDGATAFGGVDLDPSANTLAINVNSVNDAPAGSDATVTTNEDTPYTFTAANFGFSDVHDSPVNAFYAVKISSLPLVGALKFDGTTITQA